MVVMLSCCDCFLVLVCAMLQNINLFMEMNEEEFAKFLQTFVTDVWGLLMKVSMNPGQVCWAVGDRRLFEGRQLLVITRPALRNTATCIDVLACCVGLTAPAGQPGDECHQVPDHC